jgi:PhnB protein
MGPSPATTSSSFFLYVSDVDAMYKRAINAGATSASEPADMFWGDRVAQVRDPSGTHWSIATHKEDVSPAELQKRVAAMNR